MKITQDTAVTLRMKVTDSQGSVYDDGKHPVSYLHGDYDNLFLKLEQALEGQEAGFQTSLVLATEDAFGERDEALVTTMPKADFPPGIKVGGQIQRIGPDGNPRYY
ncbi:MAG: peptidylprolyl isomerase, partial [Aquitalea sp.]|nr:peptidylprolyl isomerase [Aquitalea sp.]